MKELRINWDKKEVRHAGVTINLEAVKSYIKKEYPEIVREFRMRPSFNRITGDVTYIYAWDTIFFKVHCALDGGLKTIFNELINYEKDE